MTNCSCDIDLALVDRIVERLGRKPEAAIPILHALQEAYRHLPMPALERVCELTEITPAQLVGVATFYPRYRHQATGQHLIQVCHGTACHVAGAERVTESLRRELKLDGDGDTTADGQFTIERIACLGCCTLAPVVKIDETVYGRQSAVKSVDSLERFLHEEASGANAERRKRALESAPPRQRNGRPQAELRIGLNSCCIASGSLSVRDALERAAASCGVDVTIKPVGCTGMCHRVPLVELVGEGGGSVLFGDNNPRTAEAIVRRAVKPRGLLRRTWRAIDKAVDLLVGDDAWESARQSVVAGGDGESSPFLDRQIRIVTERCGELDPLDIDDYLAARGYEALKTCVTSWTPEQTIAEVHRSGLRGRGGAGFLTGDKWAISRRAPGERKFIVCNGDEGDPGAFMDRMLMEAYPHRILEGMAIAAYAIGAREGWLYVRAEYELAVRRIRKAIEQAEARGFLGARMFGTDFGLKLGVMRGAGAFVCGEETALIASLEGRRGMPRYRPPYPSEQGLWGCPTNVNNVETYACVPWIVRNGPEKFAALGTKHSKGTKVFALAGRVARGGLIEVPMGTTIREIVEEIGGGVRDGRHFKAVQIGGPSGGCVPAALGETPIDYEALTKTGAIMGSGGLVVMDDTTCMVDVARFFLDFTQKESCGRCTFCRIGTKRLLEILERLCRGEGKPKDLDDLEELSEQVKRASLCGLGKTAPNPVLTTLRYFRDEYEAHVDGRCPAGKCPSLIRYEITDKCIGCTLCAQDCPTAAISPTPYKRHSIDDAKCVRCNACFAVCPEKAVSIVPKH